jgi:hypothetical protein
MKTKSTILCAVVLIVFETITYAQKTEVRVQKGKVVAETPTASVNVEAGQKAVLKKDANPFVTVDSQLVRDALELYKLVEKEKQRGDLDFDSVFMLVGKADKDEIVGALYFELPTHKSEASNTFTIGPSSIIENIRAYDMKGNLCSIEEKRVSDTAAYYTFHLPEQVQPGELFRFIGVANIEDMPVFPGGAPAYWKEGPLCYFRTANNSPNTLNYYRLVLPSSAILVDTNREIVAMDTAEGKLAVTMRNYTGQHGDGMCKICFLWPDEDGTTLADIPDEYHGIKGLVVDSVRIGTLEDELAHGLLCVNSSSFSFKNKEGRHCTNGGWMSYDLKVLLYEPMVLSCLYWGSDAGTRVFDISVDGVKIATQRLQNNQPGEFFEVKYELPPELTEHKKKVTVKFEAHPDCWVGSVFGLQMLKAAAGPKEVEPMPDLAGVTYNGLKADEYMTRWAFLGPMPIHGVAYPPEEENQIKAFDEETFDLDRFEPKVKIGDEEYEWMQLHSRSAVVDPPRPANRLNYVYGYAWAQVDMPKETRAVLGIGSDDAVKVWLNGELVHRHWVNRGLMKDNDLVPVTFKKGNNQLVLKVFNGVMGWGFLCRAVKVETEPILAQATYNGLNAGEYMKDWLLLGPIPVTLAGPDPTDTETQKKSFAIEEFSLEQFEQTVKVGGLDYEWSAYHSTTNSVDMYQPYGVRFNSMAYAWAQVEMPEQTSDVLSIGSDDAVKVWLNGKLVHQRWGPVEPDTDHVDVEFKQGKNQLVFKNLNGIFDWKFSCKLLEKN